jgi:hypothetical protein
VPPGSGTRTAASGTVLGHGQHFAVFTAQKTRVRNVLLVGVVAAGCDVRQLGNAEGVPGHCFFSTRYGRRYPNSGGGAWHGKQGAGNGDRVGLLLDTIAGSLTVFMNGEWLGVMQASGLTGQYRWAVSMRCAGDSVRIESAPLPVPGPGLSASVHGGDDIGHDGDDEYDVIM